ncbi:DUF4190 domain-containing protein [Roseimaritima sediminicola]|uniref:DUF4190 domain-containing protein n=1 Tax=Roseimaritima sediminicola TaxID=2662066 RepID=UPI00129838F7|nr:DUF4190 domain-containing protein [Roseimaritima sediminicola]
MSADNPYQATPTGGMPQNPQLEREIKSQAITSLVVAIVSFICCGIILAPFAIYRGNKAKALIDQSGVGQEHRTLAQVGFVLGIVSLVLNVIVLLFWVLGMVLGGIQA